MNNNVYKAPDSELQEVSQPELELASRFSRLIASIIDTIISLMFILPLMYFTGFFSAIMSGEEPSLLQTAGIGFITIALFFAINWHFLKSAGQTIGKKVMGIKVVTLDGELPSMVQHFLKRYAMYFLPAYIPMIGQLISLLNVLFIFGKGKRCIHDMVAGTKVVQVS